MNFNSHLFKRHTLGSILGEGREKWSQHIMIHVIHAAFPKRLLLFSEGFHSPLNFLNCARHKGREAQVTVEFEHP